MSDFLTNYELIRNGAAGFYRQNRGLIEVSGKEAVQFLNGLISNDAAALEDASQMTAAFPNVKGRLLALTRVLRKGDKFLFETEEATREKVFQNLYRFTFAGDFFVEDLSENFEYFSVMGDLPISDSGHLVIFESKQGKDYFVPKDSVENFKNELQKAGALEITDELYEVLRIENGMPLYGVDMDESTVVLETGITEAVNFKKGCYIGQEIIARIHFRGHVAKQLTGLILEDLPDGTNFSNLKNVELKSLEEKNAGHITSITFSPQLEKTIALAFVRYDYLAEGTELKVNDLTAKVKTLPFID